MSNDQHEESCECAICSGKMNQNDVMEKIISDIQTMGCSVIGVGGDPPWTYSVGLSIMNHPDVVVSCIHPYVGTDIINGLVDRIKAGEKFAGGEEAWNVIRQFRVVFKPVDLEFYDEFFGMGRDLTELIVKNFPEKKDHGLIQLVWPDQNGKFQWEEGFNEEFRQQQFWKETN